MTMRLTRSERRRMMKTGDLPDEIRVRMMPDEIRWLTRRASICVNECLGADSTEPIAALKNELDAVAVEAGRAVESLLQAYRAVITDLRARLAASERDVRRGYRRIEHSQRRFLAGVVADGIGESFDPRGYFVYVLWGADPQRPVYIGESTNILSRLGSHLGDRVKRPLILRVQLIRCADESLMHATESRLIVELRPLFNVAGMPDGDAESGVA